MKQGLGGYKTTSNGKVEKMGLEKESEWDGKIK